MKPNLSLRKKSAARLLAVQILYRRAIGEEKNTDALIADVLGQLQDEKSKEQPEFFLPEAPDKKLLTAIVTGVGNEGFTLDAWIAGHLGEKWTEKRLTPLQLAIFHAAAWEMRYSPKLAPQVLINEYTNITAAFFDDADIAMVNGMLQELSHMP